MARLIPIRTSLQVRGVVVSGLIWMFSGATELDQALVNWHGCTLVHSEPPGRSELA